MLTHETQPDSPANTPISPHGICAAGRNGRRGATGNAGNTQENAGDTPGNTGNHREHAEKYRGGAREEHPGNPEMPEKEAGKCREIDSNQISRSQYCG